MTNGFKFNLLPKQNREEVELIKERDNSIFYSTLLVLFASGVWLASALLVNVVVKPALTARETALTESKQRVNNLSSVQLSYGRLVTETKTLSTLLDRRIDTNLIFSTADAMISGVAGAGVSAYARESSGLFVFTVITSNYEAVSHVLANVRELDYVSQVELRSSIYNTTTGVVFHTIALSIDNASE